MPKSSKKKQKEVVQREVKYPELVVSEAYGDGAITPDMAKGFLGWEEVEGADYQITDLNKKKIRLTNNVNNRPIYSNLVDQYKQELLNKKWCGPNGNGKSINGEPIIIGKTALILNGQHSLIALVLAEQERIGGTMSTHWLDVWPEEVKMDKLVVLGVDETDDVVNTMDTCKPRSLSDVIYRSEYFADFKAGKRKEAARATDYAIRLLWYRTGAKLDAFAPIRTHAESLDFIARHKTLLKCVSHIVEEDSDGNISKYISPGYASGLMYLMAASNTDSDMYSPGRSNGDPEYGEKKYDMSNYDKASEFWVLLGGGAPEFKALRHAIGHLADADTGAGGSLKEKTALLCKAWTQFVAGKNPSDAGLRLEYETDDDGIKHLVENPTVGGIDVGPTGKVEDDSDTDATENEEEAKQKIREERKAKLLANRNGGKLPEEVNTPDKVEYDENGKPPAPKLKSKPKEEEEPKQEDKKPAPKPKRVTSKAVKEQQTEKARLADEQLAREKAASK